MICFADWPTTVGIAKWSQQGEFDIGIKVSPRLFLNPPGKKSHLKEGFSICLSVVEESTKHNT